MLESSGYNEMPSSVTSAPFDIFILERHLCLFFPLRPHSNAEVTKDLKGQTTHTTH